MNQILAAIILAFLPSIATAAVIETNEWNNMTRPGWTYSSWPSTPIDASPAGGSSPSGGSALRMAYPQGLTGGVGGGTAQYTFSSNYSEIYAGHWIKFSSPFTWNPIAQKVDYLFTDADGDAHCSTSFRIANTNSSLSSDATCHPAAQQVYSNISFTKFVPGQWYWWEIHVKLSNPPGTANGVQEIWVNDVLFMSYSNRILNRTSSPIGSFYHAPVFGGADGVVAQQQYIWFDHTVISTTRIGRPGGGTDTSPPMPPTSLQVR